MHRKIRPFRLILVLLAALIVLGVLGLAVYYGLRDQEEEAVLAELPIPMGQDYVIDGRMVAYLTENALVTYDTAEKRNALIERSLAIQLSGFDIHSDPGGNNLAAFVDSTLQIWGQDKLELNGEIAALRCGKSHVAVLRRSTSGGADSIVVFDANGNNISDTPEYSEGLVIDFGFYVSDTVGSEHELLWVIVVSLRASVPVYTIKMFEYAGVGSVSYLPQFYDQAVEKLYFTEESIFAVGTQDIVRYPIHGGRESYRVGIYGQKVTDMMQTETGVSFLLEPRTDTQRQTLRVLSIAEADESAESLVAVHLPEPYISALFSNSVLQVYNATQLQTFNTGGRKLLELELPEAPLCVYKLDGGEYVLLETATACYLASIQ